MTAALRSLELMDRQRSMVYCIDAQSGLLAVIPLQEQVVASARYLIQAAALFEIPILATEQYPQGLGSTVPPIAEVLPQPPVEKLEFSAADALNVGAVGDEAALSDGQIRDQAILVGVETHLCVLQTAYDLMSRGYQVIVAQDAVASRVERDHEIAIARLRDAGVIVTTVEAIAFEWCGSAADPQFRALWQLTKARQRP